MGRFRFIDRFLGRRRREADTAPEDPAQKPPLNKQTASVLAAVIAALAALVYFVLGR